MGDPEGSLADCIGTIYEAATDSGNWQSVGDWLRHILGAQVVSLRLEAEGSFSPNVLMPVDDGESLYADYYHSVDPYLAQGRRDYITARAEHITRAKLGEDLVPDELFLNSEFFNDFARSHERRYLLGGMIGVAGATPLRLSRDDRAGPFNARDRRLVEMVLPHLQRALELRTRLIQKQGIGLATQAALETLPVGVTIVDAGLRILFLNDAARKPLGKAACGLRAMRSGPNVGSGVHLIAISANDATTLRQLVASAATGRAGGAMRVINRDLSAWAVLVSPVPRIMSARETDGLGGGLATGLAMVVMQPVDRRHTPPAETLCEVFGLSRAEADVAVALSGGASADDVARQRGVSRLTVRSQIRAIIDKSESGNLRDFERAMASLAVLAPADRQKRANTG